MSLSELLRQHPLIAAVPWVAGPLVTVARMARSRTLDDESPDAGAGAPHVSVVIPARDEAHNIAACVESVLASSYPALDAVVVNDHSTDETGAIARACAAHDPRMRVVENPDLPAGWFGKQWACQNGADAAGGEILIFVDADTRLAPDLVARSVNGMRRTKADLYTVAGRQAMHGFWEKLVQPQIFAVLATRYGGTESINRSRRTWDKIANGQYLMVRRDTYEALGGHALVRAYVAEDLMLAQKYFAAGRKTVVVLGWRQLSTRMYTSLRELIGGWRKNVYAGGREAVPFGRVGRIFFPFMLPAMPLMQLAPVVALLAGAAGLVAPAVTAWAAAATLATLAWWVFVYRVNGEPAAYAACFPLGAAMMLYIFVTAVASGNRVSWKGRRYVAASGTARVAIDRVGSASPPG